MNRKGDDVYESEELNDVVEYVVKMKEELFAFGKRINIDA